MTQNEDQSRFTRVSKEQPVYRDYPLRNSCSDKKRDFIYDFEDSDEELDSGNPYLNFYQSWSSDHLTNNSDIDYFPSELEKQTLTLNDHSAIKPTEKQTNSDHLNLKQPPIPKVILKRSYSDISDESFSTVTEKTTQNSYHDRDKPPKHSILSDSGIFTQNKRGQNEKSVLRRKRGRAGKSPYANSFTRTSINISKNDFSKNTSSKVYGDKHIYVKSDLSLNHCDKLQASCDAKQNLQKQIQLKRRISADSAKGFSDKNDTDKKNSKTEVVDADPKADKTINIDRCLKWTYELSKSEWLKCSCSLTLLKKKYSVLKILFKKDPVIVLNQLNPTKLDEIHQTYSFMASRSSLSNANERKDHLVDPRVVSLSKTLMSNARGKVGVDKVFSKNKTQKIKQSKNTKSHTMAKSRHDLSFKLKLKEASKPKPKTKTMEKVRCSNKEENGSSRYKLMNAKVRNESIIEGQTTSNVDINQTEIQHDQAKSDLRNPNNEVDNITNQRKDLSEKVDSSNSSCLDASNPGSPGPPHLEREFMRNTYDGYSDTEMEILKMNDFEIEICRDDSNEAMPEVLDMRIGIKDSAETTEQGINMSTAKGNVSVEFATDKAYPDNQKCLHPFVNGKQGERLEVDTTSVADTTTSFSPSTIVIQNVCSLNQVYNKSTDVVLKENNDYNQRILEMLEGEIFDTCMTDPMPLDLAKSIKLPEASYDSDATDIYSEESDDILEFNDDTRHKDNNEMSPRLKALKSTKHTVLPSNGELSTHSTYSKNNDVGDITDSFDNMCKKTLSCSDSSSLTHDFISDQCKDMLADDAFTSKSLSYTQVKSKNSSCVGKQTSKQRTRSAARHAYTLDFKRKQEENFEFCIANFRNSGSGQSEIGVTHSETNVRQSDIRESPSDIVQDNDESDGCGLVISEVEVELGTTETEIPDKDAKTVKSGKSPSFARHLGKNKELREFMSKEKERRKSLVKENKQPKLNRVRGKSNTEGDDLPQILPPKRRQRVQKSLSLEESNGESKEVAMERIMADFPKHNWLFNKYNVNNEEKLDGSETKQVQDSRSEPTASVTVSVTSCSAGKVTPATESPALAEEKKSSKQHTEAQRITGSSADLYNSQDTNLTQGDNIHTASYNKSEHDPSQSLAVISRGYVASLKSKDIHLIRRNSGECTPVKDYDPTLASVIVDNSPESLVSFNEFECSEKSVSDRDQLPVNTLCGNVSLANGEKVTESSETLNRVSSNTCGTKSVATTESELTICHNNKNDSSKLSVDTTVSTKSNIAKTVVVSSVQANTITSGGKPVVSRPYLKKTYTRGKSDLPQLKIGSLKPETIQAIKQGNPALFQKQFNSLNKSDQLDISDERVSSKDTAKTKLVEDSSMVEHETSVQNKERPVEEDENTVIHDVNNKKDVEQAEESTRLTAKRYVLKEQPESLSADSNMETTGYPLNMTKRVSGIEVEEVGNPKTWELERPDLKTWTAEPLPEFVSMETNIQESEDMMVPLDLCVNRSVTENSFASYRKHHPPPVQMVHPQVQKPPSSEAVTENTETFISDEQIILEDEIKEDDPELTENLETSSQNLNASSSDHNSPADDVHSTNCTVSDKQQKTEEIQTSMSGSTLNSTNSMCENQVITTSSPKHVPISVPDSQVSGYVQTVPVVTQYRPVLVHPVQQLKTTPQTVTVPTQVIQPILTVHSNTATTNLAHPPLISSTHFNTNVINQPQLITNNQSFQQVQPIRHAQPIHSVNQQAAFQNIQFVIPTGQFFVPVQAPSNGAPIVQQFGNTPPCVKTTSKPGRRASKKILPKPTDVPSKKRKKNNEEQSIPVSVSFTKNVQIGALTSVVDSAMIRTKEKDMKESTINPSESSVPCGDGKDVSNESQVIHTKSLRPISEIDCKRDSDESLSEGSESVKREDSSDEMLEEDEELRIQMEEYRKLKEERKKKEREEIEMKKKITEKRKLAKALKHKADIKLEMKLEKNSGDIQDEKSGYTDTEKLEYSNTKEEMDTGNKSLSGGKVIGEENTKDVILDCNESLEVIAEWNVPTSTSTEMSTNKIDDNDILCKDSVNHMIEGESVMADSGSSRCKFMDTGLDLRVEQTFKSMPANDKNCENIQNSDSYSSSVNLATNSVYKAGNIEASCKQVTLRQDDMSADSETNSGAVMTEDLSGNMSEFSISQVKNNIEQSLKFDTAAAISHQSVSIQKGSVCTISENKSEHVETLLSSSQLATYFGTEQRPYSPPILTPRSVVVQQKRNAMLEKAKTTEKETVELPASYIESRDDGIKASDSEKTVSSIPCDMFSTETSVGSVAIITHSSASYSAVSGNESGLSCSQDTQRNSNLTDKVSVCGHPPPESQTDSVDLSTKSVTNSAAPFSISSSVSNSLNVLTISNTSYSSNSSKSLPDNVVTTSVIDSLCVSGENDSLCTTSSSSGDVIMSVTLNAPLKDSQVCAETSRSVKITDNTPLTSNSGIISATSDNLSKVCEVSYPATKADSCTAVIDYSSKSENSVCSTEVTTSPLPESLSHYRSSNLTRKPSSNSSSHIYVSTSSTPVTVAYSGYSKLTAAAQRRLSTDGKVGAFCEIPLAHTKHNKPEKIPKGAKPSPAHNNYQVVSLKSLIKKLNRTNISVPSQIQQSCPYFKKSLQYNWSPSPKDTYKSKLARRESPVPPPAHNQKPFSIAGKLIIPAGRFSRKRTRSAEIGTIKSTGTVSAYTSSYNMQKSIPTSLQRYDDTAHQICESQSSVDTILPPIRAHIHLEGNADTVTITNVQKPSTFERYHLLPFPILNNEKQDVVDLTCEETVNDCDKDVFDRDILLDDAEKQIQQELSEAVAKRQKLDSSGDEIFIADKDAAEIGPDIAAEPKRMVYPQETEDEMAKRLKKQAKPGFLMNHPVLPTGTSYQPLQYGQNHGVCPPNAVQNCDPVLQNQHQRASLGDVETSSIRNVLQASSEEIQAQVQISNRRQALLDKRVPPLIRLRETRQEPYVYPNQPLEMTNRSTGIIVSEAGYQFGGHTKQPHGLRTQRPLQQVPGLVHRYLVPANQVLRSPVSPDQRIIGQGASPQQLPMVSHKQSYSGHPQGTGPRYPPPITQRLSSIGSQFGPVHNREVRHYPGGQISPHDHSPRGQLPSPDYQIYNSQGQLLQPLPQGHIPRSHDREPRHMMPSPQSYQQKGQPPSPNAQVRYSGNRNSRDYIHGSGQGHGHLMIPQDQVPGATAGREQFLRSNVPTNTKSLERYMPNSRGQGQIAVSPHQLLPPPAHSSLEGSSPQWPHGRPSPQAQRLSGSQFSSSHERVTPGSPPPYPAHLADNPTMHQFEKSYSSNLGPSATPYSSMNPQTSVDVTAGNQYTTAQQVSRINRLSSAGNQTLSAGSQYQNRGQTLSENTQYVSRNPDNSLNSSRVQIIPGGNQYPVRNQSVLGPGPGQQPQSMQPQYQQGITSQKVQQVIQQVQVPLSKPDTVQQSFSNTGQQNDIHRIQFQGQGSQNTQYRPQLPSSQGQHGNYNSQFVTGNGVQLSNNSTIQHPQQHQQYDNTLYHQNQGQLGQMMPSNQGVARTQMNVITGSPSQEQGFGMQGSQSRQRHQVTLTSSSEGQVHLESQNFLSNQGHAGNQINVQSTSKGQEEHQRHHATMTLPPGTQGQQQGMKLPSNQGQRGNVTGISQDQEQHHVVPDSQRHQSTLNSSQEGQGHTNDCVEMVEVEDDIPHLQQVHSSCVLCGKFSLYLCSDCKNVWYCSTECQMSHWPSHSLECRAERT